MAQFGLRSVFAIAALTLLGNAGPLSAQAAKNPAPYEEAMKEQSKTCPGGIVISVNLRCPETLDQTKACPPDSPRAFVPIDAVCPNPLTSRCPGKIVVPFGSVCPDANVRQKNVANSATLISPKGNPGNWVPQSAYPREALRDNVEGTVGFTLNAGPDGKPTQCRITRESGNDSLDWAACENLMRRASFNPAKDKEGKPVAGTYTNRVRWVIPEGQGGTYTGSTSFAAGNSFGALFGPRTNNRRPMKMAVTVEVVINADGTQESCIVNAEGTDDWQTIPINENAKAIFCKGTPPPLLNEKGEPVKSKFTFGFDGEVSILPD